MNKYVILSFALSCFVLGFSYARLKNFEDTNFALEQRVRILELHVDAQYIYEKKLAEELILLLDLIDNQDIEDAVKPKKTMEL